MPYKTLRELPAAVKKLPKAAQKAFREAFNNALRRGLSEEEAFKRAWAAAKKVRGDKSMLYCHQCDRATFATQDGLEGHKIVVHGEGVYGEYAKDYPAATRREFERKGWAMKGGKFPIATCSDVKDAIRRIGNQKGVSDSAVKAHIRKRAKALGCSLPEGW